MPARRAAALVMRGAMSGVRLVDGTARARNIGLPLASSWRGLVLLYSPTVEGAPDERERVYCGPSEDEVVCCMLERIDECRESGGNSIDVGEAGSTSLTSSGSSLNG